MSLESLVMSLRAVPLALWVGLHLMLADKAPTERATQWGLTLKQLRAGEVWRLLTHAMVHYNEAHLISNCTVFATSALEFSPLGRDGLRSALNCALRPVEVLLGAALLVGGALGGVAGTALLHEWNNHRAVRRFDVGIGVVRDLVKSLRAAQTDRIVMCGASAGIMALASFNLVNNRRSSILGMVTPAVFLLGAELDAFVRQQRGQPGLLVVEISAAGSDTRVPTVGHAAHIGGMAVGAVVGLLWRMRQRLRTPPARRHRDDSDGVAARVRRDDAWATP